jgi:CP family cyanate transporter-like MFS transporter
MTFATAGLLGAIPVLCMGIFAPLGPLVARRLGGRDAVAACVLAILVFGLLRAGSPSGAVAIALTFGIGLGMGVVGPVLPMIVRSRASGHRGVATGAYATGMVLGGTVAAAVAVPLAVLGSWRAALAAISVAALGSLVAWLGLVPRHDPGERGAPGEVEVRTRMPWRRRSAWILGLVFGLQSTLFYATQAWLASLYLERGLSLEAAGALVVLFNGISIVSTVVAPIAADRLGSRRQQLTLAATAFLVGVTGIAANAPLPVLWVVIGSLGSGAIFPIALVLPVDAADRPAETASIAAFMLLVGYVLASVGPVVLGLARDLSGDFALSAWLLVVIALALLVAARVAPRHRAGGAPPRPTARPSAVRP